MAAATLVPGSDAGSDNPFPLPPALLRELIHALRTIQFGSVALVIHEGRVVQLELCEKVRAETEVSRRK
jgi:hypothetical protein